MDTVESEALGLNSCPALTRYKMLSLNFSILNVLVYKMMSHY